MNLQVDKFLTCDALLRFYILENCDSNKKTSSVALGNHAHFSLSFKSNE